MEFESQGAAMEFESQGAAMEFESQGAAMESESQGAAVECRIGCGACCIEISISSPIPGMPSGKPAGFRCVHLSEGNLCGLFGAPDRPGVCTALRPSIEMCGFERVEATRYLRWLEVETSPESPFQGHP